MKRLLTRIALIICLTAICSGSLPCRDDDPDQSTGKPRGTALVITGAAAKIPQEAAILEQLHVTGQLNDLVFISGVSSGALNAVMLNAILSGKYTWQKYRNLLYSINNQKVFVKTEKTLPVSTEPLRQMLTKVLHDTIGFQVMADLPISTSLSVVSLQIRDFANRTYRLSNIGINRESDPSLDLVEVMMASAAFPIVFPPVTLSHAYTMPDKRFIDGGAADDYVPYRAVLEFEQYRGNPVKKMIIVGRKMGNNETFAIELGEMGIEHTEWLNRVGISIEDIEKKALLKRLLKLEKESPDLAAKTFVMIPDFPQNYTMFDFNNMREQYATARMWARLNKPVPFKDFILSYKSE